MEPTNNRAERALRFAVLWRKIMQGTYNEKGDRWVERDPLGARDLPPAGRPHLPSLGGCRHVLL